MWDGVSLLEPHYRDALLAGQLTLGVNLGWPWLVMAAVVMVGLAVAVYWRTTRPLTTGWRLGFISLRAASLLLLLLLLLEPGVLLSEVNPQQTYVAVLVDDSQSMAIADGETSRHQRAVDILYRQQQVLDRLAEKFQLRTYSFGDTTRRIASAEELQQADNRSGLGDALAQVTAELGAFPLAGVVVVSDGADNSEQDPLPAALALGERQVPVYTLGIGATTIERDLRIQSVRAARSLLEDAVYNVDISLAQEGFSGETTTLTLSRNGAVVAEQTVVLEEAGNSQRLSLELSPEHKDILVYDVSLAQQPGETIVENNRHQFSVDNREKPPLRVLYVEGQPRNEYKFLRRAVSGDESLQLVSYLQTGPRKFLRQGIESPSELQDGFPATAEALFAYDALIFGNLERSFFSAEQLALVQEFVATRGGGFLLLGGLHEGFIDTPLAELLPVSLLRESRLPGYLQGGPRRGEHPTGRRYRPQLTQQGEYSPLLRLASDDRKNRQQWRDLPALEGVYVTGRPKPGASVLIEHPELTYQNRPLPILTTQRYGGGRSMMMATASSWRWQMLMPHDDDTHARLWRQLLRWLATESRQRLSLQLEQGNHALGEPVTVSAQLLDAEYAADDDGLLWLTITDPRGESREVSMDWQVDRDGTYIHEFTPDREGIYDLQVRVSGEPELVDTMPLLATPSRREYLNAAMDAGLLKRLAAASNGRFYSETEAGRLVDDIRYSPNPYSQQRVQSLWDQPLFWLLLVLLVGTEWALRRYRGLS